MEPFGFAYNRTFIQTMLREQLGFQGYINSDTGIVHNMCWGVEMLDSAERIGFAVNHAGVDLISGLFDNEAGMEAYNRGKMITMRHIRFRTDLQKNSLCSQMKLWIVRLRAHCRKCLNSGCLKIHTAVRKTRYKR